MNASLSPPAPDRTALSTRDVLPGRVDTRLGHAATAYAGRHRRYRAVALQSLYESETTDHVPSLVLTRRFHSLLQAGASLSAPGQQYVRQLVYGVLETKDALDDHIQRAAPRYPVHTLPAVELNILRLALFEVEDGRFATPVKVAITEAIALAECYGADASPGFVHGVLGVAFKDGASHPAAETGHGLQ